ncbi:MAG: Flp family type IVb pilin [Acidimicrobiales bacterium]
MADLGTRAFFAVKGYVQDKQDGATAVEYALLIALIGALLIAAMVLLKNNISEAFNLVGNKVSNAASNGTAASI